MQDFNLHAHGGGLGIFDAIDTAKDMLATARDQGFKTYGLCCHLTFNANFTPDTRFSYPLMIFNDVANARDACAKLADEIRQDAESLGIKPTIGFEVDFFSGSDWRRGFEKLVKGLDFDYLIGGVHYLFDAEGGNIRDLYETPADTYGDGEIVDHLIILKEAIKSGYFNFMAHLDLIRLFKPEATHPRFERYFAEIADTLAEYDMPTEINTSGIRKTRSRECFPNGKFLEMLAERGVAMFVSDDAHCVEDVGMGFEEAERALAAAGVKNRFIPSSLERKI